MDEFPLATLVHISDLHFAEKFTSDAGLTKKILRRVPRLQGVYPHSYQAARALAARVNVILKNRRHLRIPVSVVATGDLTHNGNEDEFIVAATFLRNAFATGAGDDVGLRLGHDRAKIRPGSKPALFAVPGNHDTHKCRQRDLLEKYRSHFVADFPSQFRIATQSRPIVLHGLDSTQNTRVRLRLARGRVSPEQLDEVSRRLEQGRAEGAVQVVCLHHPLSDPEEAGIDPTMKLDDRNTIATRLLSSGAHLVLAGHIHRWFALPAQASHLPSHAVAGTAIQQCSDCNFLVFDIYQTGIACIIFLRERGVFVPRWGRWFSL